MTFDDVDAQLGGDGGGDDDDGGEEGEKCFFLLLFLGSSTDRFLPSFPFSLHTLNGEWRLRRQF